MRIFDRLWDETDTVGSQYTKGVLSDGSACYFHDKICYKCQLCQKPYMHWLCSDQVWRSLPEVLHDKVMCCRCFVAMRGYMRILKKKPRKKKV